MFVNVCNYVEQSPQHETFEQAYRAMEKELELRLFQRGASIPYAQVENGWWTLEDGERISWEQLCQRAEKENIT